MKIRVATYKVGEPEALSYQSLAEDLDVFFDDMRFLTPINVIGTVEREEKSLRFHGDVSAKVVRVCGRSLREVEEAWSVPFDWFFETEAVEYVEPDSELRELIILDHPMVFRAPEADKPVEYTDEEKKKNSPFEQLKEVLDSSQQRKKKNK